MAEVGTVNNAIILKNILANCVIVHEADRVSNDDALEASEKIYTYVSQCKDVSNFSLFDFAVLNLCKATINEYEGRVAFLELNYR